MRHSQPGARTDRHGDRPRVRPQPDRRRCVGRRCRRAELDGEDQEQPVRCACSGCPAGRGRAAKCGWRGRRLDDLDAALHWHPIERSAVRPAHDEYPLNRCRVSRAGPTHAGVSPWLGRSALHAVELFVHGVNVMRGLLAHVIDEGGLAPNVVTDKASMKMIRDATSEAVFDGGVGRRHREGRGARHADQGQAHAGARIARCRANAPLAQRRSRSSKRSAPPRSPRTSTNSRKKLQKAFGVRSRASTRRSRRSRPRPRSGR